MAYQSEIEFRVKVIDAELKALEKRIERVQNPFGASGARKGAADRQARENLRIERERLDFAKRAEDDLERLRIAKARNTQRVKQRLLQIDRANRIKAAQDVARAEEALARQNARRREDLALGVGFPLLFGGGAGAVAGGALGAVAGGGKGGFGLQILFSALGQQIDAFFAGVSEAATTVASSLGGTTETLDALGEAGIKVEQSLVDQVQSLEDAGRAVAAYDAVQKELTATYGERGLQALQTLKSANESAAESTSELNAVLQAELAPTFTLISDVSGAAAIALAKLVPVLNALLNPFQGTPDPERARQVARQGRIDAGVKQRAAQIETGQTVGQLSGDVSSLQRQTEIARLNNDLTNDRVVLLRQVEIITKATSEIDALEAEVQANLLDTNLKQVNAAKIKKIEAQQALDLAKLEVDASSAVARAAEKTAREEERAATAAERKAKADARLAQRVQRQDIAAANRLAVVGKQLEIARETSDLSKVDLEFDAKKTKVRAQYARLISRALSDQEKETLEKAQKLDLELLSVERNEKISNHMRDQFQSAMQLNDELLQTIPQTAQLSDEFKTLANTINNEIINGIEGMISGTKTLGQVASSMLKQIASQMLQTAIMGPQGSDGIAGMIFGALGIGGGGFKSPAVKTAGSNFFDGSFSPIDFFANGGRPPVGKPSIVGERGPELFVPRSSGTIVPNSAMGGSTNVVVNVDAKGTAAQGDDANADQLGRVIGAAVQAELIKQKRPGGLLTR